MDNSNIIISDLLTQSNIRANGINPHLRRLVEIPGYLIKALRPFATRIEGCFKEGMTEGVKTS